MAGRLPATVPALSSLPSRFMCLGEHSEKIGGRLRLRTAPVPGFSYVLFRICVVSIAFDKRSPGYQSRFIRKAVDRYKRLMLCIKFFHAPSLTERQELASWIRSALQIWHELSLAYRVVASQPSQAEVGHGQASEVASGSK